MPEFSLDYPGRVFHLGADAGLDCLQLRRHQPDRRRLVQSLAIARLHRHVPDSRLAGVRPLLGAQVAGVGVDVTLQAVEEAVDPHDIAPRARIVSPR